MSAEAVRCPQCGGDMVSGTTSFCFGARSPGGPVLVENIPALVCRRCGHASYTLTVADQIDRLLDQRPAPTRTMTIQVYELVDGRYEAPATAASDRG
jgi:YgiT-type zinc finger domain-containing protein